MKYTKTYVGAAVFFERLADDGWPEDSGDWPERCVPQTHPATPLKEPLQRTSRLSPSRLMNVLLRSKSTTRNK